MYPPPRPPPPMEPQGARLAEIRRALPPMPAPAPLQETAALRAQDGLVLAGGVAAAAFFALPALVALFVAVVLVTGAYHVGRRVERRRRADAPAHALGASTSAAVSTVPRKPEFPPARIIREGAATPDKYAELDFF